MQWPLVTNGTQNHNPLQSIIRMRTDVMWNWRSTKNNLTGVNVESRHIVCSWTADRHTLFTWTEGWGETWLDLLGLEASYQWALTALWKNGPDRMSCQFIHLCAAQELQWVACPELILPVLNGTSLQYHYCLNHPYKTSVYSYWLFQGGNRDKSFSSIIEVKCMFT